jgi:hypothetical protein
MYTIGVKTTYFGNSGMAPVNGNLFDHLFLEMDACLVKT